MCRALEQPGEVKFWTDYLAANLGPGNVWQLPGIWDASDTLRGFGSARCTLADGALLEEFQERVRVLAEECDLLQVGASVLAGNTSVLGPLMERKGLAAGFPCPDRRPVRLWKPGSCSASPPGR